jgi:hypothetical protein
MANWCKNTVLFSGESSRVEAILELFKEIEQQQNNTKQWHLPEFVTAPNSFMLDILIDEQQISYHTMWMPNLDALREIADHFMVEFTSRFEEAGMRISGIALYHDGILNEMQNEKHPEASYELDPKRQAYVVGGIPLDIKKDVTEAREERKWHASREVNNDDDPFITTGNVTKEEINALFGDLPDGELLLKFAELKNFEQAKEIFNSMDEYAIVLMENYLIQTFHHIEKLNCSPDQYLALRFLDQLINNYDAERILDLTPARDLTADHTTQHTELLQERLAGKLPHIDLHGTDFTIDWRLRELRETESPWNKLDFNTMDMSESGDEYFCLYNAADHTHYQFDDTITSLPVVIGSLRQQGILKIAAVVNRNNMGSRRVLEKAGFGCVVPFDFMQDLYLNG